MRLRMFAATLAASLTLLGPWASAGAGSPPAPRGSDVDCSAYPSTARSDGCALEQSDGGLGDVQRPGFFRSYARQSLPSAQAPYRVRPPWNVAGVDYGVGSRTATASYRDPASVYGAGKDGCRYEAAGAPSGGAWVKCGATENATVSSIDFSLHGCTELYFTGSQARGTIRIHDNKFGNGPGCDSGNNGRGSSFITVSGGGAANFSIRNNDVDGGAPAARWPGSLLDINTKGIVAVEYNACTNAPQRCSAFTGHSELTYCHNYHEGYLFGGRAHGEFFFASGLGSEHVCYNTYLQTNQSEALIEAAIFASDGRPGKTYAPGPIEIDHNVSITNKTSGGIKPASIALLAIDHNRFPQLSIHDNYDDPSGARYDNSCETAYISLAEGAYSYVRNINMLTGGDAPMSDEGKCVGYFTGIIRGVHLTTDQPVNLRAGDIVTADTAGGGPASTLGVVLSGAGEEWTLGRGASPTAGDVTLNTRAFPLQGPATR